LHFQLNCLRPSRAEVRWLLGDWDAATAELTNVLSDPWASVMNRAIVHVTLNRVRARRGDPDVIEDLDRLIPELVPYDEAQLIAPAYLARAEAAWLGGDRTSAAANVEACLEYLPLLDVYLQR